MLKYFIQTFEFPTTRFKRESEKKKKIRQEWSCGHRAFSHNKHAATEARQTKAGVRACVRASRRRDGPRTLNCRGASRAAWAGPQHSSVTTPWSGLAVGGRWGAWRAGGVSDLSSLPSDPASLLLRQRRLSFAPPAGGHVPRVSGGRSFDHLFSSMSVCSAWGCVSLTFYT